MASFLKRYRQRLENRHGWDVPLVCTQCGHDGLPRSEGWTPSASVRFGDRPTIFNDVFCENCGKPLKEEAGTALAAMFSSQPVDTRNRRLLWDMIGLLLVVPAVFLGLIWFGVWHGFWGAWAFSLFGLLGFVFAPVSMWLNYRIHAVRHECPCGQPAYLFMGLLGRASCYRCSSCGRLLKLRD